MEKTIIIDNKPVAFKATGAFLKRYKSQFGRDPLKDLMNLSSSMSSEGGIKLETLDLEVFYDILWTLAKTANPNIPDPLSWLDSFEEFPLVEIIPELVDLISKTLGSTVQSKN